VIHRVDLRLGETIRIQPSDDANANVAGGQVMVLEEQAKIVES